MIPARQPNARRQKTAAGKSLGRVDRISAAGQHSRDAWLQPRDNTKAAPTTGRRSQIGDLISNAKAGEGIEIEVAPRPRKRELAVRVVHGIESHRTEAESHVDVVRLRRKSGFAQQDSLR